MLLFSRRLTTHSLIIERVERLKAQPQRVFSNFDLPEEEGKISPDSVPLYHC